MFIPFKWFNPSNDCRLVVVGAVAVVIIVRSFFRHLPFFDCGPVEVYFIRNAVFPYFFPLRSLAFLFGILDFGSRKWICSCCRNIIFLDLLSFCPKVTLFIFFVLRISNHHLLYFYSKKTFSTAFALILISRVFQCVFFSSLCFRTADFRFGFFYWFKYFAIVLMLLPSSNFFPSHEIKFQIFQEFTTKVQHRMLFSLRKISSDGNSIFTLGKIKFTGVCKECG